jgi:Domain of unknown function (DUF6894)
MKRYFFDLVCGERSQYDYRGIVYPDQETARQLAELMALDLGIQPDSAWSGWSVDVYNVHGERCFSIPVKEPDLVAA